MECASLAHARRRPAKMRPHGRALSVVLGRVRMVERSVRVSGLPSWIDWRRLLGDGDWQTQLSDGGHLVAQARLDRSAAAELEACMQGVGLRGDPLCIEIDPTLPRAAVRRARS